MLGPLRPYTQVELLKSDCFKLGVNPPVRNSGKLDGAVQLTLVGPCGEYTANCGILAWRHIHVDKETLAEMGKTMVILSRYVPGATVRWISEMLRSSPEEKVC